MRPPDSLPLAAAALVVSLVAAGVQIYSHVHNANEKEAARRRDPEYAFTCWSQSALDGAGYTIYPNKELQAQDCRENANFPGVILCERKVTLECKP